MQHIDEEAVYAAALAELKSGATRPGLWAKEFAECDGDERKSQALYIRLRVQHEQGEAERLLAEEAEKKNAEIRKQEQSFESVVDGLRQAGFDVKRAGSGWSIREPLGGRVRLDSNMSLVDYARGRITVDFESTIDSSVLSRLNESLPNRTVDTGGRRETRVMVAFMPGSPSGVRGWLFLLVLGMTVLGPLLGAGRISADILASEREHPTLLSSALWSTYKSTSWTIFLIAAAISIYGGWGLAKRRDRSAVTRAKLSL